MANQSVFRSSVVVESTALSPALPSPLSSPSLSGTTSLTSTPSVSPLPTRPRIPRPRLSRFNQTYLLLSRSATPATRRLVRGRVPAPGSKTEIDSWRGDEDACARDMQSETYGAWGAEDELRERREVMGERVGAAIGHLQTIFPFHSPVIPLALELCGTFSLSAEAAGAGESLITTVAAVILRSQSLQSTPTRPCN
ncbi:hypothetical protein M427DRAFT_456206 [Gonapodya prolifera JEL478]|uniref:Uncharacterized protein n=1 Tax=Gonapodya prolifera (strain JEL478) TaxID=1344416 RepID=A0A139A2M7_GONPJ|nr:hypothetical protein M427DRAFT_456206 [Gonapodya prolifera JEL478]|eukprot:KXS11037.1 hypothetical protein M427DRAFT_456206 [Gonapodya prolifera JEL478]